MLGSSARATTADKRSWMDFRPHLNFKSTRGAERGETPMKIDTREGKRRSAPALRGKADAPGIIPAYAVDDCAVGRPLSAKPMLNALNAMGLAVTGC